MKNKWIRKTLCIVLTAGLMMTGCSSTSSTEENTAGIELKDTTVIGVVTAVDEKNATLNLGSIVESAAISGQGNTQMGQAPGGEVPDKPSDSGTNAQAGDMPSESRSSELFVASETSAEIHLSEKTEISMDTVSDDSEEGSTTEDTAVTKGDVIKVVLDENGAVSSITILDVDIYNATEGENTQTTGENGGMGGGIAASDITYTAVNGYTQDTEVDGETITSTGTDENAVLVTDIVANLKNVTVDRTSSDSTGGDNSSFYGVGAAILAKSGTAYIEDSTITTDAAGGAGVFAYGNGVAYVADSDITTMQNTSGGIHAAGGGTLYAWDLNVETNGESAAAIRSDRGGGTMVVDGGTYTSNGIGSPSVYCTADIAINNATLTASGSEAICIEGLNSLRLYDCVLSGNMSDDEQNDCTWNVILYQSMSGDSEVGNSTFEMTGGTITAENGGMFYTTNTESTFYIENIDITYAKENDFFLKCTGNSNERGWGSTGSNGADCEFTTSNQEMEGNVIWDSISNIDFYMTNGSSLTGAFVQDESNAGDGGDGTCNLSISSDSVWTVTGDSKVTNLYNEGRIVDTEGNTVSVVSTEGTILVEGTSEYRITVDNYSTTVDFTEAAEGTAFSDYAVNRPAELTK